MATITARRRRAVERLVVTDFARGLARLLAPAGDAGGAAADRDPGLDRYATG